MTIVSGRESQAPDTAAPVWAILFRNQTAIVIFPSIVCACID